MYRKKLVDMICIKFDMICIEVHSLTDQEASMEKLNRPIDEPLTSDKTKPHKCDICMRSFTTRGILEHHIRLLHCGE